MTAIAYAAPASIDEATQLLAATDGAMPLAGGSDLMVQLRLGQRRPPLVIDTAALDPLARITDDESDTDHVSIGAAVTMRNLLSHPTIARRYTALTDAASLLGGRQIQAVATLGGNLCNASPAAETATPLLVHSGDGIVTGPHGDRTIPISNFLTGPGTTALQPGELLTKLRLPKPKPAARSAYRRLHLRRSVDIAIVSCSALIETNTEQVTDARIAIGAAAPTPLLVTDAATAITGMPATSQNGSDASPHNAADPAVGQPIEQAVQACAEACTPIDDVRASATYRRNMVATIVHRTLHELLTSAAPNHPRAPLTNT